MFQHILLDQSLAQIFIAHNYILLFSDPSNKVSAIKGSIANASTPPNHKQRPLATVYITPLSALQKHRKSCENLAGIVLKIVETVLISV